MEAGGASTVLAIANKGNVPLAETQAELTPFQRQIMAKEIKRQHDEAQSQQGGAGGARSGHSQISNSMSNNTVSGDTITYVNDSTD